jgi:phosphoglycolate phosphatase
MVELAVATAKPETTAERIIEHFGFTDLFTAVIGATIELGSTRRTKAQVITHALQVLGTEPGPDAVMVGDRDHDVEGALANGIACIGVSWGFGSAEELRGAGAVTVIDSPGEVVAALASTYRDSQR